jgi:threonine dehydratase
MRATSLGELPFAHLRRYLDGLITVSESEITRAMARAADVARLVLEPSGATALAAWLFHGEELPTADTVVCVLSGGNVDPDRYAELVAEGRRAGG